MSTPAPIRAIALACLLGGCAAQHEPAPKTVASTAPAPPVRLAWLPVEPLSSPEIAGVVNDSLARLKMKGATESSRAPVSMEVAQLTIECIQPTVACYAAVGRSIHVDRLLWVELARTGPGGKAIRVTVALFDVEGALYARREQRSFASVAEARPALASFIERALDGETQSAPPPAVAVRGPTP